MKWMLIGVWLPACGISLVSPAFAEDAPPPGPTAPAQAPAPTEPEGGSTSTDQPPTSPPSNDEADPRSTLPESPAPSSAPMPASELPMVTMPSAATAADQLPRKIGDKLAPLVVTAGLGYGYAAVSYPGLNNSSISGTVLELTAGTELDPRLRVSLGVTSLETKIRRSSNGGWEEGDYIRKSATTSSGLRGMKEPVDPVAPDGGGAEVQRTMHASVLGPRVDYFPLGSQGPYLGVTAAVAVLSGVGTYVGFDAGARVGAEWRPLQELAFSIEGGAHGQLYDGARATIPYGLARLNLLLDPAELTSSAAAKRGSNILPPSQQRTLPTQPTQR
jgi:hypothetical protein